MIVFALMLQASAVNWVEVPKPNGTPEAVLIAGFDPAMRVHRVSSVTVAGAGHSPDNDFYAQEDTIDCDAQTTTGHLITIHYRQANRPTLNIPIGGTHKFSDLKDRTVVDFLCSWTGTGDVRGYEYASDFVASVRSR
jgi:hypothetical protein